MRSRQNKLLLLFCFCFKTKSRLMSEKKQWLRFLFWKPIAVRKLNYFEVWTNQSSDTHTHTHTHTHTNTHARIHTRTHTVTDSLRLILKLCKFASKFSLSLSLPLQVHLPSLKPDLRSAPAVILLQLRLLWVETLLSVLSRASTLSAHWHHPLYTGEQTGLSSHW